VAATVPLVNRAAGDLLTTTLWNTYVVANINKLLNQAHRKVTVAQFAALTGIEDGDEVYLEVDSTNGIEWHLVYRTAEATYKWRYLGGPPMSAEVATAESTASTAFAALATAGPSIALPRAGDYMVMHGSEIYATGAMLAGYHSYDIGVTGAVDADAARVLTGTATEGAQVLRRKRKTGLTAVSLVSKYRTTASTAAFTFRGLNIIPVRLRHDA
jgi:hypothetical protein